MEKERRELVQAGGGVLERRGFRPVCQLPVEDEAVVPHDDGGHEGAHAQDVVCLDDQVCGKGRVGTLNQRRLSG